MPDLNPYKSPAEKGLPISRRSYATNTIFLTLLLVIIAALSPQNTVDSLIGGFLGGMIGLIYRKHFLALMLGGITGSHLAFFVSEVISWIMHREGLFIWDVLTLVSIECFLQLWAIPGIILAALLNGIWSRRK